MLRTIVHLRLKQRLCPVQIGGRLGMPALNVHAVLLRCRLNRLSHIDRITGEPVRRYEHPHPGAILHVDVTKYGNIPDDGGWRFVGRQQGERNRQMTARRTSARNRVYRPQMGTAFVHTVVDDHSRVAYAEIRNDEKVVTAIDRPAQRGRLAYPSLCRRTGPVRQRLGLQIVRLARRLR
ncbi:hypothetical protein L083_7567 [Actinoplanes sp. N902-109]|nr:hypothetical protein L083_7567 [Actinoplanes sp. N902-109]